MKVSRKLPLILCVCGIVLLLSGILSVLRPILTGGASVGIIGGAELPTLRYQLLGWRLHAILTGAALLLAGLGVLFFRKKIKKK